MTVVTVYLVISFIFMLHLTSHGFTLTYVICVRRFTNFSYAETIMLSTG